VLGGWEGREAAVPPTPRLVHVLSAACHLGAWLLALGMQVKQQIEMNMSPKQQEYWQEQGGYFDKVNQPPTAVMSGR